jgi:hypothetical protein
VEKTPAKAGLKIPQKAAGFPLSHNSNNSNPSPGEEFRRSNVV